MRSTMFEDCKVKQESFGVPRDYAKLANVGPLCPTTLALAHNGTQGNNSAHFTSLNALKSHMLNFELRKLRSKLDEASRLFAQCHRIMYDPSMALHTSGYTLPHVQTGLSDGTAVPADSSIWSFAASSTKPAGSGGFQL